MFDIIATCEKHGYMYDAVLTPKQVGVHPKNRDGEGFKVSRAVSRGVKVKSVGCRMEVAERDAIGFQDHPIHRHVAKYTMLQCQQQPDMAQYDSQSIQIGPAGCTHFNHFLATVHDERPCTDPTVSEDGKMSKKKYYKDAVMMKAML